MISKPSACMPRPTDRGLGCPPADVEGVRRWLTGHASPGPGEPIAEDLDRVENEVNEIRRNSKLCAVCGAGTRIAAAWRISERRAKRLGLLEPRFLRRWRRAFWLTPG